MGFSSDSTGSSESSGLLFFLFIAPILSIRFYVGVVCLLFLNWTLAGYIRLVCGLVRIEEQTACCVN